MAQTPLNSSTSYATPTNMITFYDVRTLGDLLTDDDTRLTSTQVLASSKLQTLLDAAAGEIQSAALYGYKYTPTDLEAIITNGGTAAKMLIEHNCRLAMVKVLARRPLSFRIDPESPEGQALLFLTQIRAAERFYPTEESADAGVLTTRAEPNPTTYTVTVQADRYFGLLSPPQY